MPKFRKRPVVIEAVLWTGLGAEKDVLALTDGLAADWPSTGRLDGTLLIPTLEGNMTAQIGDWIIKGVNGEFYPCKPGIFRKTYEPV